MATNTYKVNGESAQTISGGSADIDMSTEPGVKAGCREFPIPLLNKITVTSTEGALSSSKTIYAGYKIVNQMLGELITRGNYNTNTPNLKTIISGGRFGIFEPAHYNSATGTWVIHGLNTNQINSLINLGTGIKICVKIEYTKSDTSRDAVYVDIPGVLYNRITEVDDVNVPFYSEIGGSNLAPAETVSFGYVVSADRRSWFESVLTSDNLNIDLSHSIIDPDTTQDMVVTLMAYIGSIPTADNTFTILPMNASATTIINIPFENYEPAITFYNQDIMYNQDSYEDGYGSVAEYNTLSEADTTIRISIVAPA